MATGRACAGAEPVEEVQVPLSEDEQRILNQIEAQLYESDPALARQVGSTTLYSVAFRQLRWAVVALVLGLVAVVALLRVNVILSFGGFLLMLAAGLIIDRSVRQLGRAGFQQVTSSVRTGSIRSYLGNAGGPGESEPVKESEED